MFTFYCDPGHGWLEVAIGDLHALGLKPSSFSQYSYRNRKGDLFYLEEDCDAALFVDVYEAVNGRKIQIETNHNGAFVRRLPRIN